ncbi:MAG: hypothetical protein LBR97_04170 [Dysgonamonadaceae bacterium]|nr:hypothetical protein [Dysgonamonadaceae bacterium]
MDDINEKRDAHSGVPFIFDFLSQGQAQGLSLRLRHNGAFDFAKWTEYFQSIFDCY